MHDVSIPAALIAGLVSFLSPCVLPLVPPYLIYLTGATIEHVANDETTQTSKRAVMASALMFVLGFSTVFVALGASASLVGGLIRAWSAELSIVAGIIIGPSVLGWVTPDATEAERVTDYLAGMTDRFAIRAFSELWLPRG